MVELAGVTVIDVSVPTTVSSVLPLTVPNVAVIVVVPDAAAAAVARPLVLIVATAGADDVQVAREVRSRVLASEYVPVAVNCCVAPVGTLGFAGVTAMDVSARTFAVAFPLMAPIVAVIVAVPAVAVADAVARPVAAPMVTAGLEDVQVTWVVRSGVEPSV